MESEQKFMLNKLLTLPEGTVITKGKRQRIIVGFTGTMVIYKTDHDSETIGGLKVTDFVRWATGAEFTEKS